MESNNDLELWIHGRGSIMRADQYLCPRVLRQIKHFKEWDKIFTSEELGLTHETKDWFGDWKNEFTVNPTFYNFTRGLDLPHRKG